jgi:hypothetical protein
MIQMNMHKHIKNILNPEFNTVILFLRLQK